MTLYHIINAPLGILCSSVSYESVKLLFSFHCTLAVTVVLELLLLEVWVTLHLVDSWHYLGSLEQTLSLGDREVRDSNGLDQSLAHKLLHCLKNITNINSMVDNFGKL